MQFLKNCVEMQRRRTNTDISLQSSPTLQIRRRGVEREPRDSLRKHGRATLSASGGSCERAHPGIAHRRRAHNALVLSQDEDVNAIWTVRTKHDGLLDVAGA